MAAPLALLFLFLTLTALSESTTCFTVNGKIQSDQVVCPGSRACCGADSTCLGNRLCHNPGDDQDLFVRGPCAEDPYDEEKCARVCVYDEIGDVYPRVRRCDNGSYCCDNDPSCCSNGDGTFLDARGNIVDTPADPTDPSPEEPTPQEPSPEEPSPAPSTAPDSTAPDSTALKVGLGLGIPFAATIAGFGVWFVLRRRQRGGPSPVHQESMQGVECERARSYADFEDPGPSVGASELAATPKRDAPAELGAGDTSVRER